MTLDLSQLAPCLSLSGLELRLVVGRWKSYESIPILCSPGHFHSKLPDTCYPYQRYTLKYQLALCLGNEVRFGDELRPGHDKPVAERSDPGPSYEVLEDHFSRLKVVEGLLKKQSGCPSLQSILISQLAPCPGSEASRIVDSVFKRRLLDQSPLGYYIPVIPIRYTLQSYPS